MQYVRVTGEARFYYPIADKITFVGRAIGGYITGWGDDEVRLIDLFYKGGETIRGFNRGGFGPRDLLTNDALGGDTFWATTAEVRFPIPFIPDDLGMSGAAFVDAGSLFGAGAVAKALNDGAVASDLATRPSVCLVGRQLDPRLGGREHDLELAARAAAAGHRQGLPQEKLRRRAADPLRRLHQVLGPQSRVVTGPQRQPGRKMLR